MSDEKLTRSQELKKVREKKKLLREQEKAIKAELDEGKEERKAARRKVTRSKNEAAEKRKMLSDAVRAVNGVMLTKSIKNNLEEFEDVVDGLYEASTKFLEAANDHIEAIKELEKYE